MIILISALSIIMWYIIDRLKDAWKDARYGKYYTTAMAFLFGCGLSYAYGLDIVYAAKLVEAPSIAGQILTALLLTSGSSAVSEVLGFIKELGKVFEGKLINKEN